jgi:hypothetical protein
MFRTSHVCTTVRTFMQGCFNSNNCAQFEIMCSMLKKKKDVKKIYSFIHALF